MVTSTRGGSAQFKVYLPHAQSVEVIGDFTNWRANAVKLRREPPGWWVATLDVPPGEHEFCYLVDESIWLADYGASGVRMSRDGHWLSTLAIPSPAAGRDIEPKPLAAAIDRRGLPRRALPDIAEPPHDPTPAPAGVF